MQRRWIRRLTPRALVVAFTSVAMVVTAVAVSQAHPGPQKAVSVAMLSGSEPASQPAVVPAPPDSAAADSAAADSAAAPRRWPRRWPRR